MNKNKILFKSIVIPHGENNPYSKMAYLSDLTVDPNDLNIERIMEKVCAEVGGHDWCGDDNLPYDYSNDRSDFKTSSVTLKSDGYTSGMITSTEAKIGPLRVAVTNEFSPNKSKVDCFFIPVDAIRELEKALGGKKGEEKKRINFHYSLKNDTYGIIEDYRCDSFEDMCTMTEDYI